jgi:putative CocE/NonD family hydrolase
VAIGEAVRYPDRSAQDAKLLTYTSAVLDNPLEVTGHPVVTLFVSSTASDGAFFVYLEDVDARGRVAHVTEGQLRALHRRLSNASPPYRQVVPYRTFTRRDASPLVAGEIAELVVDLLPTSFLFRAGHRIRIAVAGADSSHFAVLPGAPPTVRVHRSRLHASRIDLPVISR